MSSKKISNLKKPPINNGGKYPGTSSLPNKTMQINMSSLSTAQKQICIKLLAQSNINFEEGNDGFQAELKIDPMKQTTQFKINQKQDNQTNKQINKVSPIKKRDIMQSNKHKLKNLSLNKNKQNIKKNNANKQISFSPIAQKSVQNLYTSSKKCLSKTVKINHLTKLLSLHPTVQLYICPKKMTYKSLIEFIETVYQIYWRKQVNNMKKNTNSKGFCQWVYQNFISNQKQKIKIQQNLVNLIQSLNHFSYKSLGVQLFYNFLSGIYLQDCLRYFLVIRALLQEIYDQKIIDKISNYASKTGIVYRMKMNTFEKMIEQDKIHAFLDVLCCDLDRSQKSSENYIQKIFNQMTQIMFYDQKKKKNFIQFHQMCEILLKQFTKVQSLRISKLQLSYTNNQNDTINQNSNLINQNTINFDDEQLQLTFSVHEQQIINKQNYQSNQQSGNLNSYLPFQASQQISLKPKQKQETFQIKFFKQAYKKYSEVCLVFSNSQKQPQQFNKADEILLILLETLTKSEKNKWLQFLKLKKISHQRQNQELYFIEKLQIQFKDLKKANFISKEFLNKIFTTSFLRQAIVQSYSPLLNKRKQIY